MSDYRHPAWSIIASVVIKNQESGLNLPSAPEFGPGGLWPPVETEWLPLRWELFERETQELEAMIAWILFSLRPESTSDDAWFKDFFTKPSFAASVKLGLSKPNVSMSIAYGENSLQLSRSRPSRFGRNTPDRSDLRDMALATFNAKELRQLVHSVRWRRKDPVIQLPPDASHVLTHTVTTGLSIEQSQTLTESLGLDLGGNVAGLQAKLSYKLQEQFGLKLNITATEEASTQLTLSNQSKDCYRVFALWQVDHRLSVNALKVPVKINISRDVQPHWELCDQAEFTVANQPFITYAEVSRLPK